MFAASMPARRGSAVLLAAILLTSGCAAGRDSQTSNQVPTQDGTNANVGAMALRGIALEAPRSGSSYTGGSAIPIRLVLVNNGHRDDKLTDIVTSVARGWASYNSAAQASAALTQQNSNATPGSSGPSASSTPGTTPGTAASPSSTSTSSTAASGSGTTAGRRHHRKTSSRSSSTTAATVPSTSAAVASSSSVTTGAETAVIVPAGQRVSWGVPDSRRVLLLLSSVGHVYPGSSVKITFTFARAGSVTVAVPVQTSNSPADATIAPATGSDG